MGQAIVQIDLRVLAKILGLKDGVTLSKVRQSWEDDKAGRFTALVESETIPDSIEGHPFPWAKLVITQVGPNPYSTEVVI